MSRIACTAPDKYLIDQMKLGKVIPIIGAGLSKSAQSSTGISFPDYKQLLEMLLDRSDLDRVDKEVVKLLLNGAEESPLKIEKAARMLREEMKDYPFYREIRSILEPIDVNINESMAHKLLRMLNFKKILTTNYDRLLERFVAPDYEVFTSSDLDTFRLFLNEKERNFILKLHGDITRPNTIPFGLSDLYRHYGYDVHGNDLKDISDVTQTLRDFLKTTFTDNTVLFLGSSLTESEGYAQLLTNLVKSYGGSLPYKHFALVPFNKSAESLRKDLSNRMNVEYITYHPDDVHSQVWEFISFLNEGVFNDQPKMGRKWGQSYLPSRRVEYLERQLEREISAKEICFLTPSMTNAISTRQELIDSSKEKLKERFKDEDFIENIINVMDRRRANLENRLLNGELQVRVLFLESELKKAFEHKTGDELRKIILRYEYLIELIKLPNLQVRLITNIDQGTLKTLHNASYALIYNHDKTASSQEADITIAYASQATVNYFEIHIIQINTSEVKDRVYQFERFWAASMSETQTINTIRYYIEEAKGKLEI